MAKTQDEIANALMSSLYGFVSKAGGDIEGDSSDDPFVAWCKPGIPFEPEDFRFAKFMLTGQGANDDERINDLSLQLTQAAGFSRFVDFVPSVAGVVTGKMSDGLLRPGSATLSEMYKRILEASQVALLPEPAGINEQIQKLSDEAAPMQAAYVQHQDAYLAAKAAYVGARLAAGYSAAEKLKFSAIGPGLNAKKTQALQAWEVSGFKTQYENLHAEIASLRSKRSPAIWRSEALANFNSLPEGQDATFGEARLTMPYPGSFATNASGWTKYEFKLEHVDALDSSKNRKWAVGGGGGWGSLKLSGSAEGSTSETLTIKNTDGFYLKLSIAAVPLLRNWFDPWFLKSEFWRFNPASIEGNQNAVVSDGGMPPQGMLIGYPVSAIFIRDVEIGIEELHDESSELVKTLKAEAKGGWGFGVVNVSGSYERNSTVKKQASNVANGKLTVEGLQLIGFMCETMEKSPQPKAGLDWVGA
jgi:hypothetical protein